MKKFIANISDEAISITLHDGKIISFPPRLPIEVEYTTDDEYKILKAQTSNPNFVDANWSIQMAEHCRKILRGYSDEELVRFYFHWKEMQEERPLKTINGIVWQYGEYVYSKEIIFERIVERTFKREISSVRTTLLLIEKYIEACTVYKTTHPKNFQLAEISSKSKSYWSNLLKKPIFLVELLSTLRKKTSQAKKQRAFWSEVEANVSNLLAKQNDKKRRGKEIFRDDLEEFQNSDDEIIAPTRHNTL